MSELVAVDWKEVLKRSKRGGREIGLKISASKVQRGNVTAIAVVWEETVAAEDLCVGEEILFVLLGRLKWC